MLVLGGLLALGTGLVGCAPERALHVVMLRPSTGILDIGELRLWSIRASSCDGDDERTLRVPIGGGRIDLLSRSEHYIGTGPACLLELVLDETDPAPLRLMGTTGDGVDFDLDAAVPALRIQQPMSFDRCEHALLMDPDPLMRTISEEDLRTGTADVLGLRLADSLWFGSRAQADAQFGARWLSLAPVVSETAAERCADLASDTGSTGAEVGGGLGCASGRSRSTGGAPGLILLWACGLAAAVRRTPRVMPQRSP